MIDDGKDRSLCSVSDYEFEQNRTKVYSKAMQTLCTLTFRFGGKLNLAFEVRSIKYSQK